MEIQKTQKMEDSKDVPKRFGFLDIWIVRFLDFKENCVPGLCFISSLLNLIKYNTKIPNSWIPVFGNFTRS